MRSRRRTVEVLFSLPSMTSTPTVSWLLRTSVRIPVVVEFESLQFGLGVGLGWSIDSHIGCCEVARADMEDVVGVRGGSGQVVLYTKCRRPF
jgi:hypothetical protein